MRSRNEVRSFAESSRYEESAEGLCSLLRNERRREIKSERARALIVRVPLPGFIKLEIRSDPLGIRINLLRYVH